MSSVGARVAVDLSQDAQTHRPGLPGDLGKCGLRYEDAVSSVSGSGDDGGLEARKVSDFAAGPIAEAFVFPPS